MSLRSAGNSLLRIKPWMLLAVFSLLTVLAVWNAVSEFSASRRDLEKIRLEHARLLSGQVISASRMALTADRIMVGRIRQHLEKVRSLLFAGKSSGLSLPADTLYSLSVPDSFETGDVYFQKMMTDTVKNKTWFFTGWITRPGRATVAGIEATHLIHFRQKTGLASMLKELMTHDEVIYAVLQDSADLLLSASGTEIPMLTTDEFRNLSGLPDSLILVPVPGQESRFEAQKMISLDGVPLGVFRLGLDMTAWDTFSGRLSRRLTVAVLLWAVLLIALIAVVRLQNQQRQLALSLEKQIAAEERRKGQADLAAGVAHELRNPLNAIGMMAQQLEKEFKPVSDEEEYRQQTRTIRSEVQRMDRKITEFLRIARPRPAVPVTLSLIAWFRETETEFLALGASKNIRISLQISGSPVISADPDQIREILQNLLLNACEWSPPGGTVWLEVREKGGEVRLSVADQGPGIPPENLGRIFDLYFTTRPEGTGLGLPVVRQLASENGAEILVAANQPAGTRFTLIFKGIADD